MKKNRTEHISSSKLFFILCAGALILIAWNLITVSMQMFESQSKIAKFHNELEELQNRQKTLQAVEHFFQSDYFVEREARLKYGLQKKGEQAVIIQQPGASNSLGGVNTQDSKQRIQQNDPSTHSLWWQYFFGR